MPISEQDISILIPTYCYRDKVGRAVESALASGSGEVIVVDDHSCDGTLELLDIYKDPRLTVIENTRNLGLWENHLAALSHATRPWIKFIQADDYLLPGGLASYAAAVKPGVSVVWAAPIVKNDATGMTMQFHNVTQSWHLTGAELLDTCLKVGWLLGSPSHMMLKADTIERDPSAWTTEISADLVNGSIAAASGEVVLLPPGPIGQGDHPRQDARTQGMRRGLRRMVESAVYLQARPEPVLQRFVALWVALQMPVAQRTALGGLLRGEILPHEALRLISRYRTLAKTWKHTLADDRQYRAARAYRRKSCDPHNIDQILSIHDPVSSGEIE